MFMSWIHVFVCDGLPSYLSALSDDYGIPLLLLLLLLLYVNFFSKQNVYRVSIYMCVLYIGVYIIAHITIDLLASDSL